jgi:hypothetical protein
VQQLAVQCGAESSGKSLLTRSSKGAGAERSHPSQSAPKRPSQPALASVLAQITRQLLGRCPRAQLVDPLVLHERPAIDGVLKPFELRLQMLHPRLERLHALLRIDGWEPPT